MITPFQSRSGHLPLRFIVFVTIVVGSLAVPKPQTAQNCRQLVATSSIESTTRKNFPLGSIGEESFQGIVEISPNHSYDLEGSGTIYNVQVHYSDESTGRRTNVLCAGESYNADIIDDSQIIANNTAKVWAGAYSFTVSGHKQLLVSTYLGQCCSYVYDYDPYSKKLRPIYTREGGRVRVRPRLNKDGRYDLEENWQMNQWEDQDDLGLGHYDSKTGYVSRLLHWNGTKFVPNYPGPSRRDK